MSITEMYKEFLRGALLSESVDHQTHIDNLEKHYGNEQAFRPHYDAVSKLPAEDVFKIARGFANSKARSKKGALWHIHSKHRNIVDADEFTKARGGRVA